VDDREGQKIWKKILTVKRETNIISILDGIERQKSKLNIWLGQINLRQLDELQHSVQDVRGGVKKVNQNIARIQQAFREEVHDLAGTIQTRSTAAESKLEHLESLSISSLQSLKEEIQNHSNELQAESSMTHQQLQTLVNICDSCKDMY
jgi:Mg2+ and Co2+ transporter CorA